MTADPVLRTIAEYAVSPPSFSERAYATARMCLLDALGCAIAALQAPECRRMLGPLHRPTPDLTGAPEDGGGGGGHAGADGVRVVGTTLRTDPLTAAFDTGAMVRWLDYNDTWLAAEWGHPSDNLGALLAVSDGVAAGAFGTDRQRTATVGELLSAMIQAYEIQGVLALQNGFNRLGLDHVLLVRVASAAVAAALLGADVDGVVTALSHAFIDGGALRTYRHGAHTGSRKSWAAGDATRRGLWLALVARRGEMGYPGALGAERWGFEDVVLRGERLSLPRELGSYVMENVLFKVAFPAEFHAQSAVEAAFQLHPQTVARLDEVAEVRIETQESAVRIIDKSGPLTSPADRDHCLQYMVAIGLLNGELTAEHYRDEAAADRRVDRLRGLMTVVEEPRYSADYLDADKRSIANAVQVRFTDGATTPRVEVEYPLGHARRREEAAPRLAEKLISNVSGRFTERGVEEIRQLWEAGAGLDELPVARLVDVFTSELESDPARGAE